MSIIENHLQIELSIDQILYRLRLHRLNELQSKKNRPTLENRSTSQININQYPITHLTEEEQEEQKKRTEITDPNKENHMIQSLNLKERSSNKRGLLMTKPE